MVIGHDDDPVAPIFYSKACRQLGVPSEMQPFPKEGGGSTIRVRLPLMPEETLKTVKERAKFLQEREERGLPTEQLPSGRWPDTLDEFADQVPLVIKAEQNKLSVYLDFGRSVQAIGVSPAVARTISMLITEAANELDPEGAVAGTHPELVNVARVKVPGSTLEQEGTIFMPGLSQELQVGAEDD
jgi:hypothetical protein